ncbi:hypothetical protein Tco_1271347 [Tanacetum coccineum]
MFDSSFPPCPMKHQAAKDAAVGCSLWTDGLICAFEAKRSHKKYKPQDTIRLKKQGSKNGINDSLDDRLDNNVYAGISRVPIGWSRFTQLVETVRIKVVGKLNIQSLKAMIMKLRLLILLCLIENALWGPRGGVMLRQDILLSILGSVRIAGGLLFELLGQSAGDLYIEEDDIPVVLRSWQAQNFLVTALRMKDSATNVNVLGVSEVLKSRYIFATVDAYGFISSDDMGVGNGSTGLWFGKGQFLVLITTSQKMLATRGSNLPQTIHEVTALRTALPAEMIVTWPEDSRATCRPGNWNWAFNLVWAFVS